MRYFTRIQLDAGHPGALEAVSRSLHDNAYSDHQFLWQLFTAPEGTSRDFLFRRIDSQGDQRQTLFYCVSARPAIATHPAWQVTSREYAPNLGPGDRLMFELRVNPTQAHKRDGRSCRDDVVMHAKKRIATEHTRATAAPKKRLADANSQRRAATGKRAEANRLSALATKESRQRQTG